METTFNQCWYFDAKTALDYGSMVLCYVVQVLVGFKTSFSVWVYNEVTFAIPKEIPGIVMIDIL